ncbi:MAG TPA: 4-hydroxy-3-methylbut-2-enyl diphosphate reductase [Nocardioidaceae bacterium]|nr:4-hydroxy-3-methylbut-2-enyl diphosphate reductase [Nocardioidaceae bacterium]
MSDGQAVFCTPLRVEARALRAGMSAPAADRVRHTGVGRARSLRAAQSAGLAHAPAVAAVGIAGALGADLQPGDIVVADAVHDVDGATSPQRCPGAPLLAASFRAAGLRVHVGTLVSTGHVVTGAERARLAATGALAVDMESAWLLPADQRPSAAVRVVADTAGEPLLRPATLARVRQALAVLPRLAPTLEAWARALGPRTALLAGPRSFCAGVDRAIDIVELALRQRGAPVYVRKQIVHNVHVVRDLEARGAIFVDEVDDVPEGATAVFSAHGVSPAVREAAADRQLQAIDATCPLVTKVHTEVRRFTDRGDTVIFIGHAGHEETEGTMGERPGNTVLVEDATDAATVTVPDPSQVSYLVQTTLSADEVEGIVDVLQTRFPALRAPASDDICYATTNRQHALRAVAADADVVLVIGSGNSSNSKRLVETAQRMGKPAHLVDDVGDVELDWFTGVDTVGITAGASAPTTLVDEIVGSLRGLGPVDVQERSVTTESVHFTLPKEVRQT